MRLHYLEKNGGKERKSIQRIISSFNSYIVRLYSQIRFIIIPQRFLDEILQYMPDEGNVLELGCGFGLFSLYFASEKPNVKFWALDLSGKRIEYANLSAYKLGIHNICFQKLDVRDLDDTHIEFYDSILTMDVMHHIPFDVGNELIDKISQKYLKPNGKFILKDITTRPRVMMWFTFLLDLLMNPKDSFYYRDVNSWCERLSIAGFKKVEKHYLWDILPYPHVLLIAQK